MSAEDASSAELRDEATLLSRVLEATSGGVWDWNIQTGEAVFSPRYSSMLGYTPEEFATAYKSWKTLVHPDDFDRVHQHHLDHFQKGQEFSIEFRMREKSGRWHWVQSRGLLIERDAQGNPLRMIGTHADIDERKQAEERLQHAQARLKLATSIARIGVWDWDVIGNELVWDDSMYRLYGLRREDFAGAYQAWISCVHPDDVARIDADVQAALRGEKEWAPEFRIIRPDNGSVRIIQAASATLRDQDGKPYRMVGTNVDITERKQAELDLARTNELLERTGRMAKVGGWELDMATQRVTWSTETARIHEVDLPADAQLMATGDRFYEPEAWKKVQAAVQQAIAHGTPYDFESPFITAKGNRIWVRVQGFPVVENGRVTRLSGTFQDITASVEARETLRASEERYRLIVETAREGIFLFDANWRLAFANARFAEILGYTRDEIVGRPISDLILPEDEPAHEARKARQTAGVASTYENAYRTKSGQPVWLSVSVSPILKDGVRTGTFGMITDITERRKAELALRESEHRLRLQGAALEATVNAVIITNPAGAIEWVNPAFTRITGYTFDEVKGRNPRLLKSGQQSRDVYELLWGTIMAGRSWSGELVNVRKDGAVYTEELTITPVCDPGGAITHFVAVMQDVTQRKSLEKQLFETQRLEGIGMLASGIAHDLNNIIAPISLSMEMLRMKYPGENAMLDIVEQSARRGSDIVRQVLTFARGMGGNRTPLSVSRLIKEMGRLMTETLPRNIELTYELGTKEDTVQADPTQIHQVLLNLAVNARDAMPHGGKLRFTLTKESLPAGDPNLGVGAKPGDYVVISVADTGVGIPPEILPRIFEPFFTTKPRGQGTGLGLSTVHGIVRGHGGFIQVQSASGVGSTFKVYLPMVRQAAAMAGEVPTPAVIEGGDRVILVADDEHTVREITRSVLVQYGFRPLMAADGNQAVELFRTHRADIKLVILDRMMPGISGETAAAIIHQMDPGMPIILATGLLGEGDPAEQAAALMSAGVRAVLKKPFTAPQLLEQIAAHVKDLAATPRA